jgi:hypothetical protein
MNLESALERWLGPLDDPPRLDTRGASSGADRRDRMILLGAGFSKATSSAAPLFGDYTERLRQALLPHLEGHPDLRQLVADRTKWFEPSELAELLHDFAGRRAVAEFFLSEPARAEFALAPGGYNAWASPLPPRAEGIYRTLDAWEREIERFHSHHLAALHPSGPPILLGRLLAEGRLRRVLTLNWDSLIELGARLVGLEVYDAPAGRPPRTPRGHGLQVYESGRQVALHPRDADDAVLLKLHGGIGNVTQLLRDLARGELQDPQIEEQLRSAFLVSVTDLAHWRDHAQWVQDAVADALRGHNSLLLGVSGADPVVFRALRERIAEWERAARERTHERARALRGVYAPSQPLEPLPLVAINRDHSGRLACMLAVSQPRGGPAIQVAVSDGKLALRGAYAWTLIQGLGAALTATADPAHRRLLRELTGRLATELDGDREHRPLLDLLCDALGPNARWAALVEGRPPFTEPPGLRAIHRWWYAPWFGREGRPHPGLLQIAAFAALVTRDPALAVDHQHRPSPCRTRSRRLAVDPWSGVVQLPQLPAVFGTELDGPCDLLPIPWPWPASPGEMIGLRGGRLARHLRRDLHWEAGRNLTWLASPRLRILPLGDYNEPALRPFGPNPEIPLPSGMTPVVAPVDWLNLLIRSENS